MRAAALVVALAACSDPGPCGEPGVVCTVVGVAGLRGFNGDGLPATASWLNLPTAVARDPDGRLVVNDYNNQRVRVLVDGQLETVVGIGFHGYAAVGVDATRSPVDNLVDVAVDPEGRLLLAEQHGARVLRVGFDGVLEHVAGVVGEPGFSGDGGPAATAHLSELGGLAAGPDGTIYLGDTGNHCVRAIDPAGRIASLAGAGLPGFGPAALASPQHVHLDADVGVLYVADTGNHAIRALDLSTGALETVAGTGSPGDDGDGGPATEARFRTPYAATPDGEGGFYVADSGNHRVRHVGADGVVRPVAGTGRPGSAGDVGPARRAQLDFPTDVFVDPDGAVLIVDTQNGTVRRIAP